MREGDRALMIVLAAVTAIGLLAGTGGVSADDNLVKLDSYAEWRSGNALIVDGQRVVVDGNTKWKGTFTSLGDVPLGSELRVTGVRQTNGAVLARELDVRPNGHALFEDEVQQGTNDLEKMWLHEGEAFDADEKGRKHVIGEIATEGRQVDRVARIVRRLAPPYLDRSKLRVYVIDNDDWNAMAMGNGAVWVFRGIMDDMTDNELAVVVGHELAHYTHEHSRRQMRKDLGIQLISLTALAAAEAIDNKTLRAVAQVSSVLGFGAWMNGFGRNLEDQADRVGMRYAYEGGYDVKAAPAVWQRFLEKYGDRNKLTNFFFSDHSSASVRRKKLEAELAYNYSR